MAVRVFRFFNHVPTLAPVMATLDAGPDVTETALRALPKVFNANAYRINTKKGLWDLRGLAELIHKAKIIGERGKKAQYTWRKLSSQTSSPFIAYQVMQDLRWLHGPYADEDDWALVGIGAWRGFKRLTGQHTPKHWTERSGDTAKINAMGDVPWEIMKVMRPALEAAKEALGPHINMFEIERAYRMADLEVEKGGTLRTPGRDSWPSSLHELFAEFAKGRIPTLSLNRMKRERMAAGGCRVCSL